MLVEVLMPKHGLNMSEGLITVWHKKVGDAVKAGDVLFEFETEKATVAIESKTDGVITEILFPEQTSAPVNDTVLFIETDPGAAQAQSAAPVAEAAPALATEAAPPAKFADETRAPAQTQPPAAVLKAAPAAAGYVPATPYVKKLAKDSGVDLRTVAATGANGRITAADIAQAGAASGKQAAAPPESAAPVLAAAGGEEIKLSRIKKITGERMGMSFATVPHIYFTAKANLERLVAHRASLLKETGVKYTYSDFILLACARALAKFPIANATYGNGKLYARENVNIGFATATDAGLVVPVVHEAQRYTLPELARRRKALVEKALAGKLDITEMEGGTFTITNLGGYGIDTFDPIVNPPEAAILAVGSIGDEVVAVNGGIKVCPMVTLRLAADHRVLDGAECAQFLSHIKKLLQLEEMLA